MAELAPFIDAVITNGQVKDPRLFRDSLYDRVKEFLDHVRSIADARVANWWASGFRFELDVDVSGMVSPAVTAGGSLNIRFEWERLTCTSPRGRAKDKLRELVEGIAEDLDAVSEQTFGDTAFFPHQMIVGLGVTASGSFGVVNASLSAIGSVMFSNGAEAPPPPRVRGGNFPPLDRVRFRRGLRRAARLGHWVAQRASRLHPKRWSIYELAVNYCLGAGGTIGLVTLTGQANVEMDFFHRETLPSAYADEPPAIHGEPLPELSRSMEEELDRWSTISFPRESHERWDFEQLYLQVNPYVTLTAGIAQIQIQPQFGFLWLHDAPAGCVAYKP